MKEKETNLESEKEKETMHELTLLKTPAGMDSAMLDVITLEMRYFLLYYPISH